MIKFSCAHGFLSLFSFKTAKEYTEHVEGNVEGTSAHSKSITIIGSIDKVNLAINDILCIPDLNYSMHHENRLFKVFVLNYIAILITNDAKQVSSELQC